MIPIPDLWAAYRACAMARLPALDLRRLAAAHSASSTPQDQAITEAARQTYTAREANLRPTMRKPRIPPLSRS